MRQSKAMSPDYSVTWWRERGMRPPEIDPQTFLEKKIQWRYAKGLPETVDSTVLLGDSCYLLGNLSEQIASKNQKRFSLLFTSPPYIGISDYHKDQWLRLWMLGGRPNALRVRQKHRGAFESRDAYKEMLSNVFTQAAEMMSQSGYVYVRTDARKLTFEITRAVLREAFPRWREKVVKQPYSRQTQTALYGDDSAKPGEMDIILTGPRA
jgi:hypothetical protein